MPAVLDGDALAGELIRGVLDQALVEGAQNLVGNIVESDTSDGGERRVVSELSTSREGQRPRPLSFMSSRMTTHHIGRQQIMQLCRELDTGWTSADNDKVQQVLALHVCKGRLSSKLKALEDTRANPSSILDVLEEVGMLFDLRTSGRLSAKTARRARQLTPGVLNVCEYAPTAITSLS